MNCVLLAYHFPPDRAVGALRPAKVARYLLAAGHRVTVITARLPGERGARRDGSLATAVHPVTPIPNPREAYLFLKRRLARGAPSVPAPSMAVGGEETAELPVPAWKRLVGSLLWLPDDRQGFILPAVAAALRRAPRPDLIYTSGPPFSVHLAGLLLKRLTGARWAAEFRDPWTDNPGKPPHVRSPFSDAAEGWLERRCLAGADHVVSVTDGIAELLGRKAPERARARVLVVRNGIDRLDRAAPPPPRSRPLRVVYVGSFYHRRDPRPFLRAAGRVARDLGLGPERLQIELIGDCRWYHDVSVEEFAAREGLAELVRFRDWIPHEACLRETAGADLLVLFAQDQPRQVPNKVYEYLGTRRPILAITDEGAEVATMLRQVGGHHVATENAPERIAALLHPILRSAPSAAAPVGDEDRLAGWTTEHQMSGLVAALAR